MLGLTVLAALPLAWHAGGFRVSSETRVLLEGDSRNLATYEKVESILGDTEVVVIDLEHDDLFSNAGLDTVRRISEAFTAEPGVLDVKSLTHSSKPVRRGLSFAMVPFVPPGPLSAEERARLKQFCLTHPLVRNVMVSADGRHTLITVTYRGRVGTEAGERALTERVNAVLAPFRAEGLKLWAVGLPLAAEEIRATLRRDLRRLLPVGAALLLVVLGLTFRSWRALLLVGAQQGAALALLPELIAWSGFRLSLFSAMVLPLLGGIQLTLLAHVFSGLRRGFARYGEPEAALRHLQAEVFKPSVFAALTTLTGLLSLTASEVAQVRDFGKLGALGLGFVFFLTFGPGLSLVALVARRWPAGWAGRRTADSAAPPEASDDGETPDRATRWVRWLARRRWLLLGGAAVLFVAGAAGTRFIRTDIRAVEFLSPHSPTRRAMEALNRVYGGINVVQIEFDTGRTNGVNDLAFLKYLESVHAKVAALPEPSGVYSYASLLAMMNQIWEGERPGSLRLPDNRLLLGMFVLALKSAHYPFLAALADPAQRTAYLVVRTPDLPVKEYLAMIHRVVALARESAPPGVTVSAAAGLHSILEADQRILRSQTRSLWLTLVSIGLALALLWRSARLALWVVATNLLPVLLAGAAAALAGVPLNSLTVMVAAVTLGLAVDDSIHLVTQWREERRAGLDAEAALAAAFRVKARPVVWTSVILVVTFLLLCGASFPPVVHFGALGALALTLAVIVVFTVLPAALTGNRKPGPPPA
jgi:predicted RND superfamily exporter protein